MHLDFSPISSILCFLRKNFRKILRLWNHEEGFSKDSLKHLVPISNDICFKRFSFSRERSSSFFFFSILKLKWQAEGSSFLLGYYRKIQLSRGRFRRSGCGGRCERWRPRGEEKKNEDSRPSWVRKFGGQSRKTAETSCWPFVPCHVCRLLDETRRKHYYYITRAARCGGHSINEEVQMAQNCVPRFRPTFLPSSTIFRIIEGSCSSDQAFLSSV